MHRGRHRTAWVSHAPRPSSTFRPPAAVRVRRVPVPIGGHRAGGALYRRFGLSYRDVEELLAERGITVEDVTVYRWVVRFTPFLAVRLPGRGGVRVGHRRVRLGLTSARSSGPCRRPVIAPSSTSRTSAADMTSSPPMLHRSCGSRPRSTNWPRRSDQRPLQRISLTTMPNATTPVIRVAHSPCLHRIEV